MVWSKHKIIPCGFTDFKWKKNRFYVRDAKDFKGVIDYKVIDTKTDNVWWVEESINNSKTIGATLNDLYERNGYLRRECSKQTFLANKYKKDAEDWKKMYFDMMAARDVELKEANLWYNKYKMLKIEQEKRKQQEADWEQLKEI